jgi:hypothetical protein
VLNELKHSLFEFALGFFFFPENLGAVSEEQGERFHQDIKEIERRFQGRWNVNLKVYYCWTLQRDIPETSHNARGRTTYAASPAREKDSARPWNKI